MEEYIKEYKNMPRGIQERIFFRKVGAREYSYEQIKEMYETGFIESFLSTKIKERILILIDYYVKNKSLKSINSRTIYEYRGKIVNIGNIRSEIRKSKKNNNLDKLKEDFYLALGLKLKAYSSIDILEIYCNENNVTLDNLPKGEIIFVFDDETYNIKKIVSSLKSNHKDKNGFSDEELKRLEKLKLDFENPSFEKRIAPLYEYYLKNGTLATISSSDCYMVGQQLRSLKCLRDNLRVEYWNGRLDKKQRCFLESMGFTWGASKKPNPYETEAKSELV